MLKWGREKSGEVTEPEVVGGLQSAVRWSFILCVFEESIVRLRCYMYVRQQAYAVKLRWFALFFDFVPMFSLLMAGHSSPVLSSYMQLFLPPSIPISPAFNSYISAYYFHSHICV